MTHKLVLDPIGWTCTLCGARFDEHMSAAEIAAVECVRPSNAFGLLAVSLSSEEIDILKTHTTFGAQCKEMGE